MDTPPEPSSQRPAPRPIPVRPKRDYAAEEAARQRLVDAQILLRRGLLAEAEAAAGALLADNSKDAGASELLGDIAETRGDLDAALAAYQAAMASEPGRASAEAKIGKLVLRRVEASRRETLGVAYAATDTSLVRRTSGERSSAFIILGSVVCPGLGQLVQGQIVKGGILVGIFVLGVILLTQVHGTGHGYFTPAFWAVLVVLAADWLYAVADASATSSQ